MKAHGENAIRRVCLAHAFYQQHGGEDAVFRAERDLIASRGIAVEEFTANNADFAKELKEYLFTDKSIVEVEQKAEGKS